MLQCMQLPRQKLPNSLTNLPAAGQPIILLDQRQLQDLGLPSTILLPALVGRTTAPFQADACSYRGTGF